MNRGRKIKSRTRMYYMKIELRSSLRNVYFQ